MGANSKEMNDMRLRMLIRQTAWCVMLGIDCNSEEFIQFASKYYEVLDGNVP
jgi:hypothetical protein